VRGGAEGRGGNGGGKESGKVAKIPDELRDKRFTGFVKHLDTNKGYGFIECVETRVEFDRDIFVDMPRLPPGVDRAGDPISFMLVIGRRGFPEASACKKP